MSAQLLDVTYRYRCTSEGVHVEETRDAGDAPPTACVNDGAPIEAGTLTIVAHPDYLEDVGFLAGAEVDFANATVYNLSHASLDDIGSNSHAQLDAHVANDALHRSINDAGSSSVDLWSASKIGAELAGKSDVGHTHTASDVTDFAQEADARIAAQKGAAGGLATLDGSSKIPASQLPALAITSVSVVADQAARDALSPQEGDVAKVNDSDGNGRPQTYIYDGSAWVDIQETSDVISVNGQSGVVSLSTADVNEGGSNLYFTDARVNANANVAANSTHRARTDNPHQVTAAQLGLGNVPNLQSNLAASAAPSASDDANAGYAVGSLWVDTDAGRVYQNVDASAGAAVWRQLSGGQLHAAMNFATASSVYSVAPHGTLLYAGAPTRTIVSAHVVASINTAAPGFTFDVRLVDASNSDNVLAEATGLSGAQKAIHSLGAVSNVPSGNALLEVQVRRSGTVSGPERAFVYAILVQYA